MLHDHPFLTLIVMRLYLDTVFTDYLNAGRDLPCEHFYLHYILLIHPHTHTPQPIIKKIQFIYAKGSKYLTRVLDWLKLKLFSIIYCLDSFMCITKINVAIYAAKINEN